MAGAILITGSSRRMVNKKPVVTAYQYMAAPSKLKDEALIRWAEERAAHVAELRKKRG